MRVTVRLFAGLRERAGAGESELDLPAGSRLTDVWARLGLGEEPEGLLYAVNKEYASGDRRLADGDEVALIPPVSGGAFRLTPDPIDVEAVIAEVADDHAGAIATFLGTTRIESRGRTVVHLEYEAYEGMAEKVMAEIADALAARYELCKVAMAHRIGRVGHRRDERRHRRLRSPPRARPRSLQGGDRHAQGGRAALEEGDLRGRRGVDRAGLLTPYLVS